MPFVIISIIISIMICLSFFIAILRTCLQSIIIVYSSKMICWGHIWHYILPFIKLKVYSSYYIRFRGGSRNFFLGGGCWVPILAKFLVPKFRLKWADLNGSSRFQNAEKNSWLLLNELYSNNTESKNTNITIGSKQKYFYLKFNGSTPQAGRNSINNFLALFTF